MIKLEKGAKVKVRLHTGEVVVEAEYYEPSEIQKHHLVKILGGRWARIGRMNSSRFVGNPCDIVPVVVSV